MLRHGNAPASTSTVTSCGLDLWCNSELPTYQPCYLYKLFIEFTKFHHRRLSHHIITAMTHHRPVTAAEDQWHQRLTSWHSDRHNNQPPSSRAVHTRWWAQTHGSGQPAAAALLHPHPPSLNNGRCTGIQGMTEMCWAKSREFLPVNNDIIRVFITTMTVYGRIIFNRWHSLGWLNVILLQICIMFCLMDMCQTYLILLHICCIVKLYHWH